MEGARQDSPYQASTNYPVHMEEERRQQDMGDFGTPMEQETVVIIHTTVSYIIYFVS